MPLAASAATLDADDLLSRAVRAAGGRARLGRVKGLNWAGSARVGTGDKTIELGVRTRVEPFVRARSATWLAGRPETTRTLIIEPDGGFVERDGTRTALPERQARHERQQYGLYGYMLLVQAPTRVAADRLIAERPGLPPASFRLEGPYLAAADYAVASPDSDATINQRFLLEGELRDRGIRWPRTITIFHGDALYFMLDLDSFSVELA